MRALAAVAAVLSLAACERARGTPTPRPPALILDFTRGTPAAFDGLKAYVGSVKPLLAMALDEDRALDALGPRLGMVNLDGIDRKAPLHLLLVDDHSMQVVLVAKIGDGKKLDDGKGQNATIERRDGWTVIGRDATAVHAVAPYALSTLAGEPGVAKPTIRFYAAQFVGGREQSLAMPSQMGAMRDVLEAYFDGAISVAKDTDVVSATVEADATRIDLAIDLDVKQGSRFAQFLAAQHASDYHLVAHLPGAHAIATGGGYFTAGPYHDAISALMPKLYGTTGSEIGADYEALMRAATGELGMTWAMSPDGMAITQIIDLADPKAADTALDHLQQVFATAKTVDGGTFRITYTSDPGTTEHDGARVRSFTADYDTSGAKAATMAIMPSGRHPIRVAVVDKALVLAMGDDADARVNALIDRVHGKGTPPSPFAGVDLLAASHARKDSFALVMDLAPFVAMAKHVPAGDPAPILMSMGGPHFHVVVPAAAIKALSP